METEVVHAGIGTTGPACPICGGETEWLSDGDATTLYYACRTCRRVFNFYLDVCVSWPRRVK